MPFTICADARSPGAIPSRRPSSVVWNCNGARSQTVNKVLEESSRYLHHLRNGLSTENELGEMRAASSGPTITQFDNHTLQVAQRLPIFWKSLFAQPWNTRTERQELHSTWRTRITGFFTTSLECLRPMLGTLMAL